MSSEKDGSESSSDSASSTDSSLDGSSDFSDSDSDVVTPEFLESLLEKARKNYAAAKERESGKGDEVQEEQIISLGGEDKEPYASIHPGGLCATYWVNA